MSASRRVRSLLGAAASLLRAAQGGGDGGRARHRERGGEAEVIGAGHRAIRVDYAPSLDGDPDPGEVVWTWVAYEDDPSQGKDRPVVVIGRRASGARGLVGVALTSKRREHEPQVGVGTGSWDRDGRPSWAKVDRILDIDPRAVRREGAVLDRERFVAVVDGVRRELGHR